MSYSRRSEVNELNQDVYAGDILRRHYRREMDEHARLAKEARATREHLERVEADQRTAAERATSLMETLARYGGMLPASADTLPKGRDAQQGSAGTESGAVPDRADAQNPESNP